MRLPFVRRARATALAGASLVACLGGSAPAATGPACPGDRFAVVERSAAALIGSTPQAEILVVQGLTTSTPQVAISTGCSPVRARLKKAKGGVVLKASWPKTGCAGEKKVGMKATISAGCEITGILKKSKQKPIKFKATPSTCGDRVVDPARGEECEPGLGCGVGGLCVGACRCRQATTVPTLPPRSPTTTPTTATTSTTRVSTPTTSTTLPPTGSCQSSAFPTCGGECVGGYACTTGLCADFFQLCFAHDECDSGFCVFTDEEFGFCADFQSCAADDECDSETCVLYNECFCWYP
jgi:hypothetical protein